MGISVEVYDGDNPGTSLGTVENAFNREWLQQLNEPGNGSLQILLSDPDTAILDEGNIVRFSIDGTVRFAFVIESPGEFENITENEEADEVLTVSGPGVLAVLEDALVYPELGVGRLSPATRVFNFASTDFDDASWGSAVQIKRQGDLTGQWDGAPGDWPDDDAYWIWTRAQSGGTPPQPVGDVFFRKSFNLATEETVGIFFTADDGFEVYLDGELIGQEQRAFEWAVTHRHDVFLDAGDHLIAVKATQIERAAASVNVAGFICTIMETSEGGQTLSTVIARSDNTWKALDYPIDPPTMAPGEVLRILREEAQTRTALTGVTDDFTDPADSDSNSWTDPVDQQFPVGIPVMDVVRSLVETSIDVEMSETLVLSAYNREGLGSDKTGSVELEDGVHLARLRHSGRGVNGNVALVQLHTGEWVEVDDAGSVTTHGRKEVPASIGSAPSDKQADRVMQAYFRDNAEPRILVEGEVLDVGSDRPYVDWTVGDTILVPDKDLVPVATRIRSLHVSEAPPRDDGEVDGIPIYHFDAIQGDEGGS